MHIARAQARLGDVDATIESLGKALHERSRLVLELPVWQAMAQRLEAAGTDFILKPQVRYPGEPGEQWTMFFCDPFGNPIEIKGFRSLDGLYAR